MALLSLFLGINYIAAGALVTGILWLAGAAIWSFNVGRLWR